MRKRRQTDDRKISAMKNLGPACERDLNAVGINTAEDLKNLGAEAAFLKMLDGRVQRGDGTKCCNAAYLYAIYGALHDIDWRKVPQRKKNEFKRFTAELRESGHFGT